MKLVDAPRLPKLPFIFGDLALLLLAGAVFYFHPNPMAPLPLIVITVCFVIGIAASFIPFLVNYARDQEEANAALRRELGEQFKRLMAASEHLQHASAQLKTIEEVATKNLQAAEKLPYRLQEKIAEFNQQLAESENEEREALEQELAALRSSETERLNAAADKVAKTTAEWTKLEADTRAQLAAATQLEQKLAGMLGALEAKLSTLPAPPPAPAPAPAAAPVMAPPEPPVVNAPAAVPDDAAGAAAPAPVPEPAAPDAPKPPRKPRAPRKPRIEEPAAEAPAAEVPAPAAAPPPAELIAEPVVDEPPAPENFSQVPAEETKPAAAATDGRTRLTVVSYVGIGNKLYLRGEGPGLSWDKGVPLQFVSIGRWRWETGEATAPVTCKIYKNDKIEAPVGQLVLEPGTEQEVNAAF